MTTKKLEVEIRAGRVMCSHEDDYVSLEIIDKISGIQFADIKLPFEAFGQMVVGSHAKVEAELRGLEYVGKKREYERASVNIGEEEYDALMNGVKWDARNGALARWLRANHARDGWLMDTCLGSRTSIERDYKTKVYTLNFGYFRYVDPT